MVFYLVNIIPKENTKFTEEEFEAIHDKHLARLQNDAANGPIVLSGPTIDVFGGLMLIKAESLDAAKAYMDADPMVANDLSDYEVTGWDIFDIDTEAFK